jgi:KRAB domain-containing zinc finger protein
MSSKRARVFKCERCNEGFDGMAALRQHCKVLHGDQKYYKCNVCSKLFSHPSSRNIHLRLHSGEKPYKCETCGKRFRVSSHLKDHIRVHTGKEYNKICKNISKTHALIGRRLQHEGLNINLFYFIGKRSLP